MRLHNDVTSVPYRNVKLVWLLLLVHLNILFSCFGNAYCMLLSFFWTFFLNLNTLHSYMVGIDNPVFS